MNADMEMNWKHRGSGAKRTLIIALMVMVVVTPVLTPAIAAAASANTVQAELRIEQPRHVGEPVGEQTTNGTRVYVARGKYLEIEPQNFQPSKVTSFGVKEDEAVLNYDKSDREYVLNTQGTNGTYHLSWTVSKNNSTTVHRAVIRVEKADYAHTPAGKFKKLKKNAARGSELISRFEDAGDPDTPVKQKVDFAIKVLNFKQNPFSAFQGQFLALQTLRFMTPAGWVDLAVTIGIFYALTRGMYGTLARLRKQLEKEEQVSRREDIQYVKMFKQTLAGKQMSDVDAIDDHQAAILEDRLGNNLFTALRNFWSVWGADSLKRMYVDGMGAVGYAARVHRDDRGEIMSVDVLDPDSRDPMADGGEREPEDSEDVETELDGPTEVINLSSAPGEVLDALTWEQVDDRVFQQNPDVSAVDHLMVQNRERGGDLISEMNISVPEDFQSRQDFMEAIGRFLEAIQETEFTDEENRPREDRTVLNHLMVFTTVMEQEYNVPLDLWWRGALWNAEGLDRDDEARDVLDDITDAGTVIDDANTDADRFGGGYGAD